MEGTIGDGMRGYEIAFLGAMVIDFEKGFKKHIEGMELSYGEMLDVAHDYAMDFTMEYRYAMIDVDSELVIMGRNMGLDAIKM